MNPVLSEQELEDHLRIEELEAQVDKTDIREGLSLVLSLLAAGAAITAIGLVIAFNAGDDDEQVVTQAAQPAAASAGPRARQLHPRDAVRRRGRGVQAPRPGASGAPRG